MMALQYREAKAIALIVTVILWAIAIGFWTTGSGVRSMAGPLKGGDFVQFYAMGEAVARDPSALLYDVERLHAVQVSVVPASDAELYLPVYPPQSWLLFVPFTAMPYGVAAALWTLVLIGGYGWIVRSTWQTLRGALPDGRFVAFAAAAFPPFWNLVINGQNTIVPLAAFYLAWRALERNRPFLAGVAFGLLFVKPTFGLALAAIVLLQREWAMLAGLSAMAALQVALVGGAVGVSSFQAYVEFMMGVAQVEHLVEPDPFELHSLRAIARWLPGWTATAVWLAASGLVIERTWRVWRSAAPPSVRMGLLVTASVLVNPHLFAYDATVLILPWLWLGAWLQREAIADSRFGHRYWQALALLGVTFLVPTALFIRVQLSVLLLVWLHVELARVAAAGGRLQSARQR